MGMIPDPYKALNLPHTATLGQIKESYRQLARKHHPDTWSQPCFSDVDRQIATAKFTAISNAYALLSDAQEKADYDRTYRLGGYREEEEEEPSSAASANTANTGRNNTHTNNNAAANNNNNNANNNNNTRRPKKDPHPPPPPPSCPPPPLTTKSATAGCYWTSAIDPVTRRVYYYNKATGERSWSLIIPKTTNRHNHNKNNNTDYYVSDSNDFDYHRQQSTTTDDADDDRHNNPPPDDRHPLSCTVFLALLLCPPLGIIAMYHSIMVQRCWKQGFYTKSRYHARLAPQYACWANCLGICFWLYMLLVRGGKDNNKDRRFEWWPDDFDFDWNDWGGDGGP